MENKIVITSENVNSALESACTKLNISADCLCYEVVLNSRKKVTIEAWSKINNELQQPKLRKCPDCEKDISRKAETCPHCGCPIKKTITCPYCDYDTDKTYEEIQILGYKISCPNCEKNIEVSTPEQELIWEQQKVKENNQVTCPFCQSTNVHKIGGTERAVSVIGLGIFSKKINKSFKCNNCSGTF